MKNRYNILSFKENFSWSLLSSFIFAFSQWLIISILAKFGSVEMVGLYSLGLAITAPIFLFLLMNLRVVVATDASEARDFSNYLKFRVVTTSIAFFMVFLITLLFNFSWEYKIIINLIALVKLVESLSDVCYGKFQQVENIRLIAISKLWRALFSILAFFTGLLLFNSLVFALIGQLLLWIIVLIFHDLKVIIENSDINVFKGRISKNELKSLAIVALPLGITATLDSLNTNVPRYFISYFQDEEALGIFAGITYIMIVGQTLVTALSQVTIPRFAKYYINDKKNFKKLLYKLLMASTIIGFIGVIFALFLGDFILLVLYSNEFVGYSDIFILSMIAAVFWYSSGFLNAAIMSTRKFKVQVPIFICTVIMTTFASLLLIPHLGLTGAAIALIIGHFTRFVIAAITLKRIL
ncbi:oligosaccharide flippase family protein [Alkalihalobacillus sp. MEB130]|uniref:oligosaccharide flippase family protein n=1 Tax=Alkalihalobacillus sp. MEB130 TaxID=2976704 RepID=UPI0028DD888D|nr:oligosaccharide flippase family protein [Alkalihalobacillus sp. MEB130]MDT8860305.1 oligosaccharide flippase family protein [Alkalihalobacillus sp. MEB130]